METNKIYTSPLIEWIPLDNEISLSMESNPPLGPEETMNNCNFPSGIENSLV